MGLAGHTATAPSVCWTAHGEENTNRVSVWRWTGTGGGGWCTACVHWRPDPHTSFSSRCISNDRTQSVSSSDGRRLNSHTLAMACTSNLSMRSVSSPPAASAWRACSSSAGRKLACSAWSRSVGLRTRVRAGTAYGSTQGGKEYGACVAACACRTRHSPPDTPPTGIRTGWCAVAHRTPHIVWTALTCQNAGPRPGSRNTTKSRSCARW